MMMTVGTVNPNRRRTTVGLILLVVGMLLILWSWGSWVYRAGVAEQEDTLSPGTTSMAEDDSPPQTLSPEGSRVVQAIPRLLMVTLVVVVIALFGTVAIRRAGRRYFETAARRRARPTRTDDAWSQYRLPDDLDD